MTPPLRPSPSGPLAAVSSDDVSNESTLPGDTLTEALDAASVELVRTTDLVMGSTAAGASIGAGAIDDHIFPSPGTGNVLINAVSGLAVSAEAAGVASVGAGLVQLRGSNVRLLTLATERLEFLSNGAWEVAGSPGVLGYPLQSQGPDAPPEWRPIILASLGANTPAVTAATTNVSAGSFTIPANSTVVGHTYRGLLWYQFVHTAAATPTLIIEWLYGGVSKGSITITPISTAATFNGVCEAILRFRSIGAAASGSVTFRNNNDVGLTLDDQNGGASTTVGTLDTTVPNTLELRMRMGSVVASNTLSLFHATLERVLN